MKTLAILAAVLIVGMYAGSIAVERVQAAAHVVRSAA